MLAKFKDDDELCLIPTVILTTSLAETDVLAAYKRGRQLLVKPVDFGSSPT